MKIENNLSSDDYAQQILCKTYNFAANHTEYSGGQIANINLNNERDGTYYSSHDTVNWVPINAVSKQINLVPNCMKK